jgi:1-acyl-sn-glycerol-3-phosphate acyltransferase
MTTPSRLFRQFTRGLALVGLLFFGLAVLLIRFPMIDASAQQAWIKRWSIWVSRTLGLKLQVRGQLQSSIDSALIVANHSSWLDIVVINSIQPSAFIAKAEIEKWPIVGLLVARSGTLFIERGKRHAVHKVGTTNDGTALLPFHGNLMEAAIRAEVPVQPFAIAYRNSAGMLATTVEFVGETTFVGSMLRVLGDNDLHVMVHIARAEFANEKTRHELANHARVAIASALGFE